MPPQVLFNKHSVFDLIESQKKLTKEKIKSLSPEHASLSDEEVISAYANYFDMKVPVLNEAGISVSEKEIDIDISHYPMRMILDRSKPFYVKGTEITIHAPYVGERLFFSIQPNTFTLNPPRAEVNETEICLIYTFTNDMTPPNLKEDLQRDLQGIKSYLKSLEESVEFFRQENKELIRAAWMQRKKELGNKNKLLADLGLPIARNILVETQGIPQKAMIASSYTTSKESAGAPFVVEGDWNVFISHASEDKTSIAKPLADALIARGLKVWFDEYTLTIGDSLRTKIDEGLAHSQFGIVILSKAFFDKHWTEQELNGLAAREVNHKKVILPVWHDISRDEVLRRSPMLADRLGAPSSLGIDKVVEELIRAMTQPTKK